tara:strand:- start:1713 stop:2819 length:1107 start_codon:yes stop_codon:yes gene_type:complete
MKNNKKVIILYPYYSGISGAYNRYLVLEKLLSKTNLRVKFILIKDQKCKYIISRIMYKFIKFLKVEAIIFFYSVLRNFYFITDYNPSITALLSKNVFIQIHDVSWINKEFVRHNLFFYRIFRFFIKNYSNIITVSKTSMYAINKVSGRKKRISFLYNTVTEAFIKESNNIGKDDFIYENKRIIQSIDFNSPNILYIASLIERKRHLDLLESLSNNKNFFNVNLIGIPTDRKILEFIQARKSLNGNDIKSKINYYPKLSQKDLCYLLLFSSAYISTSMDEGFGIPVLEAELYNIPLIIRDIDINRELFPKAKFFKTNSQLTILLNDLKILSKSEIEERKKIISLINQDNINKLFSYSNLSKKIENIILN